MSPLSGTAFLGRDRPEACAFLTVGRIATTWRCSARLIRERFYLGPKIGFTSVKGLTPTKTVMRSGVLNSNGLCASGVVTARLHADLSTVADRKSTRLNSSHLGISYAVF